MNPGSECLGSLRVLISRPTVLSEVTSKLSQGISTVSFQRKKKQTQL